MTWLCVLLAVPVSCFFVGFAAGAMGTLFLTHGGATPRPGGEVIVQPGPYDGR